MIKALGHRVLVKADEIETTTESGIYIVQDEKLEEANMNRGTVVSFGEKAFKAFSKDYDGEPWVQTGDRVLYSRFAGKVVEDPASGDKFTIMNDEDLIAVITEEE